MLAGGSLPLRTSMHSMHTKALGRMGGAVGGGLGNKRLVACLLRALSTAAEELPGSSISSATRATCRVNAPSRHAAAAQPSHRSAARGAPHGTMGGAGGRASPGACSRESLGGHA